VAAADQVEAAAVHRQCVDLEVVDFAVAHQGGVVDADAALVDEALQQDVDGVVVVAVVLGAEGDDVELLGELGHAAALGAGEAFGETLPQVLDTVADHGAVEEAEHREREIQKQHMVDGRVVGAAFLGEAQQAAVAAADGLDQRVAVEVDHGVATGGDVAQ